MPENAKAENMRFVSNTIWVCLLNCGSAQAALEKARELTIDLLTNGWLQIEELRADGSERTRYDELLRIREMYVPELIIRLHRALQESRSIVPR